MQINIFCYINRYFCLLTVIKTKKRLLPVFYFPKNETLITFKVRTSQEAHILLSEHGSLYARSRFLKVLYVAQVGRRSSLCRSTRFSISLRIQINKNAFMYVTNVKLIIFQCAKFISRLVLGAGTFCTKFLRSTHRVLVYVLQIQICFVKSLNRLFAMLLMNSNKTIYHS